MFKQSRDNYIIKSLRRNNRHRNMVIRKCENVGLIEACSIYGDKIRKGQSTGVQLVVLILTYIQGVHGSSLVTDNMRLFIIFEYYDKQNTLKQYTPCITNTLYKESTFH